MSIAILLLLIVLFFVFVFFVVKAAGEWRWYHITSAVITMLLAILFLFPTAGALESRSAWHKVKEELEERLEKVKKERQVLQYGNPNDVNSEGLKGLSLRLSKIGTEAGRRWRGLQVVGRNAAQVTLRKTEPEVAIPGAPGDGDAAANPTGPLVPVGLVVYGFAEGPYPDLQTPVPRIYLGEFKVTASVANSVTVAPTIPLQQNQADAIANGVAVRWSLYEMLPLDGHTPFIAEGSKPGDDNVLGRVDDKLVNMLLGKAPEETRNSYLQDGASGSPEDPAARWIKVQFEKKYTIDVDSPEQRGALEGPFFDNNGRAVDSRLQNSATGSVELAVGDTLVVKEEAAKQLIDQEKVAKLVDTYYLRPLNDYRYVLRRIRLQIEELDTRIAEMEYEKQVLNAAKLATEAMQVKGQTEKLKLEQDLAQYQTESTAIRSYRDEVQEELRQMNESASTLFRRNHQLLRQIEELAAGRSLTDT